jgi:Flp pilus assembly protein TadD
MRPTRHALPWWLRPLELAALLLIMAVVAAAQTPSAQAGPALAALLARAHVQEQNGHLDLAAQTWKQALLLDPNDHDALLGLARAARLNGNDAEAAHDLDLLRHAAPGDTGLAAQIAVVQRTQSSKARNAQLQQAAQLAQQGRTEDALRLYRSVWAGLPPDADWALAYYDTEASSASGRAEAIAGLRTLAQRSPDDARTSITLGRVLTYSPATRAEGLHLLERFPQDASAQKALQQAQTWTAQNTATAADAAHRRKEDTEAAARTTALWADVQRGTTALSAKQPAEAIAAYQAALKLRPNTIEALNGLAGAYLQADDPAQAIPVYRQMVKLQPQSSDAWRGLFDAQLQARQPADALETADRIPAAMRSALQHDPAYLRSLAAAYLAMGRNADAEATLQRALVLAATGGKQTGVTEARLQYAALLAQSSQFAKAASLYREVLYDDPESLPGWQGLIDAQHQSGHDADAVATVQRMAPSTYDAALNDNGFLTMLAGIYRQQNHPDVALDLLRRAAQRYAAASQPAPAALQLQIASIELQQNHPEPAFSVFRSVLAAQPESAEAWKGLIEALHQSHRDRDALAQLRQIPAAARRSLDRDVEYEQAVAGIEAATGNTAAALQLIAQIQQYYRGKRLASPAEIDIQNVWLLYNTHDDRDLYRALMALGDREDLSDPQRVSVQNIWATWSVRRAGEAVDAGNAHRAVEILRAAALAFPTNRDVAKALAGGYLKAGDAKSAMAIYGSIDLTNASASDYQGMVGAALALPNLHQAELWLRVALDRFANDPQILALAARFEQTRGDHTRAAQYWKASLAAAPAGDPANRLAQTLDRIDTAAQRPQDTGLSGLLDPDAAQRALRPALPGYRNPSATTPAFSAASPAPLYGPDPLTVGTAPIELGQGLPAMQSSVGTAEAGVPDAFAPPDLLAHTAPVPPAGLSTAMDRTAATEASSPTELSAPPSILQPPSRSVLAAFLPPPLLPLDDQLRAVSEGAPITLLPPQASPQLFATSTSDQPAMTLPPLSGAWSSRPAPRATPADNPHDLAAQQLAAIAAGSSPWNGASGSVSHRTGTAGFDELYILEAPFESSATIAGNARLTAIVTPSFLASGQSTGTSTTFQLGTLSAGALPAQQNASGVGGELQLSTANLDLAVGTTPRGFLVANITGRLDLHPAARPFHLTFVREAVRDSQLSYSGLNDPGTASLSNTGKPWGAVVSNAANVQLSRGDAASGYYAGVGGQYLTGLNVLSNRRYDGVAGAYWRLLDTPGVATVTLGANFFGMHYDHNLRYFSYGQGGYFSPSIYFLAGLPLTVKGQYGPNLHYLVSGTLGLQAFQEASSLYYPLLGPATAANGQLQPGPVRPQISIPSPANNPSYPGQSVVGSNYDLHAEVSAHLVDRWYVGGFVSLNNTRNYASQTAGFFLRYMARPSDSDRDAPTGLFPASGQRPLLVP